MFVSNLHITIYTCKHKFVYVGTIQMWMSKMKHEAHGAGLIHRTASAREGHSTGEKLGNLVLCVKSCVVSSLRTSSSILPIESLYYLYIRRNGVQGTFE